MLLVSIVRLVITCALLLAPGSQQLLTCAGWASPAQSRMACCERTAHCDTPAMADACCAAGEQDESGEAASPAVVSHRRAAVFEPASANAGDTTLGSSSAALSPFAHLRNTVLLI